MGRLSGKRAIVTGAGSGIGRACALRFAEEGARVLAVDLAEAGVNETAAQIARAGGRAEAVAADAADDATVAALVGKCVKDWGGLEAIHANAGVSGAPKTILDLEVDDWWPVLRVNLIGPFLAIKHAGRAMLGAALMLAAACIVARWGVDAERRSLEDVAPPLATAALAATSPPAPPPPSRGKGGVSAI